MSRHDRRSCKLPTVFQVRSAPGSSASQKPAAPFLPVCHSRECQYSSKYHRGQHLHLFPRHLRPLHRMVADCGYHGQLSDILPQERDHSFHIGDKKLRKLIDENPDAEFILWNGSRPQIKRRVFERFVDEKLSAI